MARPVSVPAGRGGQGTLSRREAVAGYLFILPWIVGFVVFTAGPIAASLFFSFTNWKGFGRINGVGLKNYEQLFTWDELFRHSLRVSATYTLWHVPLFICFALAVALLLNSRRLKGLEFYRLIYYLPSVVAGVASAITWQWIFDTNYGVLNGLLGLIGIPPVRWLTSPEMALPAFVVMGQWGIGGAMIIFLAGLKGIPEHLYEAAAIDGANAWQKFRNVTLPMLSPTVFFVLILTTINSFQVFTAAYIITQGGPMNATLFYYLLLYQRAFRDFEMGVATAMAWVLFLVIMGLTILQFRLARRWVYYEAGA
jgi:multiple sugar transport system permease protein